MWHGGRGEFPDIGRNGRSKMSCRDIAFSNGPSGSLGSGSKADRSCSRRAPTHSLCPHNTATLRFSHVASSRVFSLSMERTRGRGTLKFRRAHHVGRKIELDEF
jgi:hypothetical protein